MSARFRTALGFLLLSVAGCSAAASPAGDGSQPSNAADGNQLATGVAGAHVWFSSSTGIELRETWSFDTFGPDAGPPPSGTTCATFERAAMSSDQLAALADLVLLPLADTCPVDGFDYHQLTVTDSDGSAASYRDTGCSFLRVAGATAMLPQGAFSATLFPLTSSSTCPQ